MLPSNSEEFLVAFLGLFTQTYPGSDDFLGYLASQSDAQGRGDEASVVDTVIIGPLLGLLGFEPAERVYNQQKAGDRPDFAPRDAEFGTCFLVEDKNTSLTLDLDMTKPDGHLRQLARYVQAAGRQLGWLTNGRRFMAWRFDGADAPPTKLLDLDVAETVAAWKANPIDEALPEAVRRDLETLFAVFRKAAFAEPARLEKAIAVDEAEWRAQALPLGAGTGNESVLVEALQSLVKQLSADARRTLGEHLARFEEYESKAVLLSDDGLERADERLATLRASVLQQANTIAKVVGLTEQDLDAIETTLVRLEQDARAFANPDAVRQEVLAVMDEAIARKHAGNGAATRQRARRPELANLVQVLDAYSETAFTCHQRLAGLRQRYRHNRAVHDDYQVWVSLVQETMLGDLDEEQRRDEFALQAAYVVFIRLLLIRVCEDKGIFPQRFITDGGFKHWQEDIERYLQFANGNPYEPLLDMAYKNAQNIYAHFFTGRELFNWYTLDRQRLILTLHELARFDFADVDSDIVGDVYNTYLRRKEKKKRGQYYTPTEIVNYILDNVGYVSGPAIIGPNRRLLDPACGSGKFLVLAAKRLVDAYPKDANGNVEDPATVLEQVRNNLFGFDLNPFACYLAEVNLLIQVLPLVKAAYEQAKTVGGPNARPPQLSRFHIYNVDALARPARTYFYAQMGTLMADERDEVEKIKERKEGYGGGFAFVVANPPYGAKLTDSYKKLLKTDYADVFRGQPDTYVFFYRLALQLLAKNGRLGFITPNTFLMGTNTNTLRERLLSAGRIEQIVDLPQGIWDDANVDCVLLFLAREEEDAKRRAQQVQVNLLGLKDTLDKLTARQWAETLTHEQGDWMDDAPNHVMPIRYDPLLDQVEEACRVPVAVRSPNTKVLRLDDVIRTSRGVEPYPLNRNIGSPFVIKPQRELGPDEKHWKPLLDSSSYIGRFEMRWGSVKPYLNYGDWLYRAYEPENYDSPKILLQDMRNRALKRRLVATYDDYGFYNRHNFSNILSKDKTYDLKYVLALFNSSLLNYVFTRQYDNLHINPSYFKRLPFHPADLDTQAEFARLVDELLARHAALNAFRADDYLIKLKADGNAEIVVPYDKLLAECQRADPDFPVLSLFDARAAGLITLPTVCDPTATISSNVFIPTAHPQRVVLRYRKLWLDVPDDRLRRYLAGYLARPQWRGHTYDAIKTQAILPDGGDTLDIFFQAEQERIAHIQTLLDEAAALDREIDEKVLDLYGITDAADRQRILGSAPATEEDPSDADYEEDQMSASTTATEEEST